MSILLLFPDRDPGNVEVLTDLLLEKWRNVPEARQLGDETAKFFRREMETTWGQSHLAVLSEDEAQRWLLGVSLYFIFQDQRLSLILFKIQNQYASSCIVRLKTKNRQDTCRFCFNLD